MGNGAIYLAGLIFALMAFIHLARIFCPFDVILGHYQVPQEFSYVGFILFGLLSVYLFRGRRRSIPS
jgi:hypothetical protein